MVELWNKIDLLDVERRAELKNIAEKQKDILLISAETGDGIDDFRRYLAERISGGNLTRELWLGGGEGEALAWLYGKGRVDSSEVAERALRVIASLSVRNWAQFDKQFG